MVSLALVFPGQGAQAVGMGRDLAEKSPAARAVFERADRSLGLPISRLCFEGPEAELTRTEVSQPALYVAGLAALAAVEERLGRRVEAVGGAGLSLGEYTALAAGGAFSLEDGLRLVRRRGELMQAACNAAPSGMASLLGADLATAEAVCRDAAAGGVLVVANVNAPDQVAISGDREAIGRAVEAAKARGVKRAIPLKVAGAFHSPLMKPAADGLRGAVEAAAVTRPRFPIVTNAWARAVSDPAEIRRALVEQLTAPVRWVEGVRALAALGARRFLELGPGKVCSGLVKRILPEAETLSVGTMAELDAATSFVT